MHLHIRIVPTKKHKQVMLNKKTKTNGKYNVAYNLTLMPPFPIIEYKCLGDMNQKAYVLYM